MKTILLAIAGDYPDRPALRYAMDLCAKMKARLSVLQVVSTGKKRRVNEKTVGEKLKYIRKMVEETMMEITFAEYGETYVSQNFQDADKDFQEEMNNADTRVSIADLRVVSGKTSTEITGYLRSHREVILAVYDASGNRKKRPGKRHHIPRRIFEETKVPFVTMKNQGQIV